MSPTSYSSPVFVKCHTANCCTTSISSSVKYPPFIPALVNNISLYSCACSISSDDAVDDGATYTCSNNHNNALYVLLFVSGSASLYGLSIVSGCFIS